MKLRLCSLVFVMTVASTAACSADSNSSPTLPVIVTDAERTTTAAVETVAPGPTTGVTDPRGTSPSTAAANSDVSPADAFAKLVRSLEAPVLDIYEKLGQPTARDSELEQLRAVICSPTFVAPDKDKVGVNIALVIRGKATNDPELGERWLEEGILTVYERKDQADGMFFVNIEWNDDVLNRLVVASVGLYESVAADDETYCADLR